MKGAVKNIFYCVLSSAIIIMSAINPGCSHTKTKGVNTDMNTEKKESISQLENLCPPELFEHRDNSKYGELRHVKYNSKTCGMERAFNILLPANYDESKKYPVFYMIHGIFGDENSFTGDANMHIKELFGNMTEDGLCEEMFVVFPNMFAATDPNMKPSFSDEAVWCYDNFINELTADLMPFIEANFNVKTGRENTAICGFSMGGRETLYITIQRPDLAAYVGAIAPAPGLVPSRDWAMQHKGMLAEEQIKYSEPLPKVLMVCCGTNDGTVGKYPLTYHNLLEKNGTEHYWYEVQGADHDNNAIRSGLYHILQFAFR